MYVLTFQQYQEMKQQKHSLREGLICYFIALSEAQREVQQLKNRLISSPNFNPFALLAKIAHKKSQGSVNINLDTQKITKNQLLTYITHSAQIPNTSCIYAYFQKHSFNDVIDWEQFFLSLLPFTPDVLRNTNNSILQQIRSSNKLEKQNEKMYWQMLRAQMFHIQKITGVVECYLGQTSWSSCKKLMMTDLQKEGCYLKKVVNNKNEEGEQFSMIRIREWLQLWINISEKQVMYMMRWMKGSNQISIAKSFQVFKTSKVFCNCNSKILKKNAKSVSKQKKLGRYKSQDRFKAISRKTDVKKSNLNEKNQKILRFWCQYVMRILQSQKVISEKRDILSKYIEEVEKILKTEVLSKKSKSTSIGLLIKFIETNAQLDESEREIIQNNIKNLLVENRVIFSIFTCHRKTSSSLDSNQILEESLPFDRLKTEIAVALKIYCLTKSKLIQISRIIQKNDLGHQIFELLNSQGKKYLTKKMVGQILREMGLCCSAFEKQILLGHFGDGTVITKVSFCKVFQMQAQL